MNKSYIRILAEVAIVLSAAGMMTGCVNKTAKGVNSSKADIVITTDAETTTDEIIADNSSNIESSSSSESSEIESKSESDGSSNAKSNKIEDSSVVPNNDSVNTYSESITPTPIPVIEEIPQELCEAVEDTTPVLVEETPREVATVADYAPSDLYTMGRLYWGDYQYTWYSENVLPGYGLEIEGRHTDADGFVCDGDGYICVAASSLSKGTVVDTPFGRQGKVYDTGCDWGVIDCYTSW